MASVAQAALWAAAMALSDAADAPVTDCFIGSPEVKARDRRAARVKEFALMLVALRSIYLQRQRRCSTVKAAPPISVEVGAAPVWLSSHIPSITKLHPTDGPLVHNFLPVLLCCKADNDLLTTIEPHYQAAALARRFGNGASSLWQASKAGRLTPAHVDVDGNCVTKFAVCTGQEVILAWRSVDLPVEHLPPDSQLEQWARMLWNVPSFTVVHARAGDLVTMEKDTVHIVVTVEDKVHLAWHLL